MKQNSGSLHYAWFVKAYVCVCECVCVCVFVFVLCRNIRHRASLLIGISLKVITVVKWTKMSENQLCVFLFLSAILRRVRMRKRPTQPYLLKRLQETILVVELLSDSHYSFFIVCSSHKFKWIFTSNEIAMSLQEVFAFSSMSVNQEKRLWVCHNSASNQMRQIAS